MRGFITFISRGSVIELAVAVVVGAAFNAVVQAFVKDLLTPLIAAIGGKPDFSALAVTLNGSVFRYGDFINALLAFAIDAAAIYYLIVVPMNALAARRARAVVPTTRECPECLTPIPRAARRCAACTSPLTPE